VPAAAYLHYGRRADERANGRAHSADPSRRDRVRLHLRRAQGHHAHAPAHPGGGRLGDRGGERARARRSPPPRSCQRAHSVFLCANLPYPAALQTGGRIYDRGELDAEWTRRIERFTGPIEPDAETGQETPVEQRQGVLWDWHRALCAAGFVVDTKSYTCCFRVDLHKCPGKRCGRELIAGSPGTSSACAAAGWQGRSD
jgi:hypothetical protein